MGNLKLISSEQILHTGFWEPKNHRSSEMFLGIGKFLIASVLPTNGRTPSPEILKPSYCTSGLKNWHFPHFTTILFLSRIVRIL